jgi:hypothetical protein
VLACYARFKEVSLSPFIDHFILAEKGYEKELFFLGNKKIILENKITMPAANTNIKKHSDGLLHLLFSGTLAETTGVFYAIDLIKALHRHEPRIRLLIIGYCAQNSTFEKIKANIESCEFIRLIGGDRLVPHQSILAEIERADFGIVSYAINRATENSIPTKLYEYLGYELPILITNYMPWKQECDHFNAAIAIDFNAPDIKDILKKMETTNFYTSKPTDVFWADAELIGMVEKL